VQKQLIKYHILVQLQQFTTNNWKRCSSPTSE